jgi:hypothetical protein
MNIEQHKANRRRQLATEEIEDRKEVITLLERMMGDTLDEATVTFKNDDTPILNYPGHRPIEVRIVANRFVVIGGRYANEYTNFGDAIIAAEMTKFEYFLSKIGF